jgi:hypothetical protein
MGAWMIQIQTTEGRRRGDRMVGVRFGMLYRSRSMSEILRRWAIIVSRARSGTSSRFGRARLVDDRGRTVEEIDIDRLKREKARGIREEA